MRRSSAHAESSCAAWANASAPASRPRRRPHIAASVIPDRRRNHRARAVSKEATSSGSTTARSRSATVIAPDDEGILQLRALLGDSIDELIVVPLPHWRGPGDVLHLMSLISPVDRDLVVVYSRLLPVAFRERLLAHGCELVEVPDDEFETMGTNVLALGPRDCLMVTGNPRTRERSSAQARGSSNTQVTRSASRAQADRRALLDRWLELRVRPG